MKINLVELASDLAMEALNLTYGEEQHSEYDEEEECMKFKEDYQDLFDMMYDRFLEILESQGLKNENT